MNTCRTKPQRYATYAIKAISQSLPLVTMNLKLWPLHTLTTSRTGTTCKNNAALFATAAPEPFTACANARFVLDSKADQGAGAVTATNHRTIAGTKNRTGKGLYVRSKAVHEAIGRIANLQCRSGAFDDPRRTTILDIPLESCNPKPTQVVHRITTPTTRPIINATQSTCAIHVGHAQRSEFGKTRNDLPRMGADLLKVGKCVQNASRIAFEAAQGT
jgi:hypothetical protein